jgi:CRISPR system Cascade subunit CasB
MNESTVDPRCARFCEHLSQLGPGERAQLKRNAGRTLAESRYTMGLFFGLLPTNVPQHQEETYFLVATLYPLAESGNACNLGESLREARDTKNHRGLDRRVEILLDADAGQLPFRLRQAVRLLYSKRVPVNWPRLLQDLLAWDHPKHYVQENWARAYFAPENDK